jgi:uncharacterized metal-binding protein YceD (DUF177 family)
LSLQLGSADLKLNGLRLASVVVVEILATPADDGWMLDCKASGSQILECSRSTKDFEHHYSVGFQVLVEIETKVANWELLEEEDDDIFRIRLNPQSDGFSIEECLRQSILLEQPISPISNPGDDFTWDDPENQGTEIDPRWNALLKLKKSDSSESKK